MQGYVDRVTRKFIEGWAWDPDCPDEAVQLRIYDNGIAIGDVVAELARDDLQLSGRGDGRHAFKWVIPGGLSPAISHLIEVRRLSDGWKLRGFDQPIAADAEAASAISVPLAGSIDLCDRELISGWVWDKAEPTLPVPLQILDGNVLVARVLANHYRKDLKDIGLGDGRCAFQVRIPGGLSPLEQHIIRIRHESDTREVPGSPFVIEPSDSFDIPLERAVTRAIDALGTEHDEDRVLSFLSAQSERLLRRRAERESKRASRIAYREFQRGVGSFSQQVGDPGLRALVIDDDVPDIARDAGSQAVTSHMRALQSLGYSIFFSATQNKPADSSIVDKFRYDKIEIYQEPHYASIEDILKRQRDSFDLIYLHRISNAERYMALAHYYNRRARIVYSVADLHHLRVARQAEIEQRPELLNHSRYIQLAECTSALRANAVITHSTAEAENLRRLVPGARVFVVPWEVPLLTIETPIAERHGIAFIAGFRHRPNADAAWFLITKIMPLVWQRDPTIKCFLAGSHVPDAIRNIEDPRIEILGAVDYLEEVFERARLTVAPLRFGAGIKGKILNSFAAGIPCVMTPIGSEGLPLGNDLQTLIGNTPEQLAECIVTLHDDIGRLADLSSFCQDFIATCYSRNATVNALKEAIEKS